jgi:hypothetical protein
LLLTIWSSWEIEPSGRNYTTRGVCFTHPRNSTALIAGEIPAGITEGFFGRIVRTLLAVTGGGGIPVDINGSATLGAGGQNLLPVLPNDFAVLINDARFLDALSVSHFLGLASGTDTGVKVLGGRSKWGEMDSTIPNEFELVFHSILSPIRQAHWLHVACLTLNPPTKEGVFVVMA